MKFPATELNQWYQKYKRDLPWRQNGSPYKTWISEIMLQQTQVNNVIPYFNRFLQKFPTLQKLASAKEDEVLQLWSGLGYYSRARNLHKTAQKVVRDFGGVFPNKLEDVLELPGIGPYTAGAILSIAFDLPHPILDGNVKRVLGRFYLENDAKVLWKKSKEIVESAHAAGIRPGEFNQALMELGAMVCLPKNASCLLCPIQKCCGAKEKGLQEVYPAPEKKAETIEKHFAVLILDRETTEAREYLVRKRGINEKWLKGLWEFPMVEIEKRTVESLEFRVESVEKLFSRETGMKLADLRFVGNFTHSITKHKLTLRTYRGTISHGKIKQKKDWAWVSETELETLSSSSLLIKAFRQISH